MSKTLSIIVEQVIITEAPALGIKEKLTDKVSKQIHQENLETTRPIKH
jgi:hypothetical protein